LLLGTGTKTERRMVGMGCDRNRRNEKKRRMIRKLTKRPHTTPF